MAPGNPYTFSQLVTAMQGEAAGHPANDRVAAYLLTDSRKLTAPGQTLFFALRTAKNDGHRYIPELIQQGVRLFVVERADPAWVAACPDAGFIQVQSPLQALQLLAAHHRSMFSLRVIGVTGSNGKTIVKEWLAQLLDSDLRIVRNPKSYNSQSGVPLSVWQIAPSDELGIFEAGISQSGEMGVLEEIIRPGIGVFTNIGSAHDAGFSSRKEKIREKMKLFRRTNTLVCCADHAAIVDEIPRQVRVFSWGRTPGADLRLVSVKKDKETSLLQLAGRGGEFTVRIPFTDDASVENAMHCICVLLLLGIPVDEVPGRMEKLQPVAMRLELKRGLNNCQIINDSYNSDLNSLSIALDYLNSHSLGGPTTLILSDILQSGMPGEELYEKVAGLLESKQVERLIGIGPEITANAGVFTPNVPAAPDMPAGPGEREIPANPRFTAHFFPDTERFLKEFDFRVFRDETILLKGARVFEFERIGILMQRQDHQTILEINLDALVHNLNVYRSMLKPGVKTMGMVKAFSYGSGSLEVASLLQYHRVDCLAVAYADEGKELRQGGISLPIVVMNPEVSSFDILTKYRLEPEIYSMDQLQRLTGSIGLKDKLPLHLKIDSGMHRLGFLPDQVSALASELRKQPGLRVSSVFSHFAASGEPMHDDFTRKQLRIFLRVCEALERELKYPFLRHISNSAAVARFPEAHLDMVRLGIGLYGVSQEPALHKLLRNVSRFRSVVSQVKTVAKGQTVGYSRAWEAVESTEVAIIPVGYADGLNRRLGNGRGKLFVRGLPAPIVGNISMDSCAIDVTGLGVTPGDEVEIFGPSHPVAAFASDLETIPYEALTSVSQRVKRVYYQE